MNQLLAVVLTSVAIVSAGIGALFGLWMMDGGEGRTDLEPVSVTVVIDYGDGTVPTYEVRTSNATAYGALLEAARPENGGFVVEATYWSSFDSTLVNRIGNRTNSEDGMYWQYRVNGEYVNVGCDRCRLHDGDVVEWSFEVSGW